MSCLCSLLVVSTFLCAHQKSHPARRAKMKIKGTPRAASLTQTGTSAKPRASTTVRLAATTSQPEMTGVMELVAGWWNHRYTWWKFIKFYLIFNEGNSTNSGDNPLRGKSADTVEFCSNCCEGFPSTVETVDIPTLSVCKQIWYFISLHYCCIGHCIVCYLRTVELWVNCLWCFAYSW